MNRPDRLGLMALIRCEDCMETTASYGMPPGQVGHGLQLQPL